MRFLYLKIAHYFKLYRGAWVVSAVPLLLCIFFVICVGLDLTTLRALIALVVSWISSDTKEEGEFGMRLLTQLLCSPSYGQDASSSQVHSLPLLH